MGCLAVAGSPRFVGRSLKSPFFLPSIPPALRRTVHFAQNCHFCRKVSHSSAIGQFSPSEIHSVRSFLVKCSLTEGELMKAKKQMACPFIRPPQGLSQRDIEFLTSSSASCLIKGSAPARLYAPRSRTQHDYSAHRCTAGSLPYVTVFCRVSSLVVAMARWHLDALPLRSSSCANERMACKFLQAQYFPFRQSASVLHATKVPCVSA